MVNNIVVESPLLKANRLITEANRLITEANRLITEANRLITEAKQEISGLPSDDNDDKFAFDKKNNNFNEICCCFHKAIEDCNSALKIAPGNSAALSLKVDTLIDKIRFCETNILPMMLKNGKLEMVRFICKNMIEDCNSVLEIAPGNSDAPSLKVNTLIAKAQATFKIGKEWYLTSRVSEAFKKFSRAINHCEQALKIDPKNSEARFLRDEIWCYQGKFKEVIKLANETYQKDYSGMMAYLETLADRYPQIRDEYDKLKKIEIEKRKTPDAKQEVFGDPVKYFLLAAGLLPKAAAYFFGSMTSSYGGNILPKKPVSCNFFEKYNTNTFEDEPGLKCYPGFDKL